MTLRFMRSYLWYLIGLVALLVLPQVVSSPYIMFLLNMAIIFVILALGLNVVFGMTGMLNLASLAFSGIGAYTSGILAVKLGLPFPLALIGAVVVAMLFGLMVGLPTIRIGGHYLAFMTIAFGEIMRLIFQNWTPVTGGALGLSGIKYASIGPLVLKTHWSYYYLSLTLLVIMVYVANRIRVSKLGRAFEAVRGSEVAARALGINTYYHKVLAFVLGAAFGGVAGTLYAFLMRYVDPGTFTFEESARVLTMVMVGGRGSIPGVIIGAFLLTFLPEWLRFLKDYYMAMYGLGILLIVLFLPGGVISLWDKVRSRFAAGRRAPAAQTSAGKR